MLPTSTIRGFFEILAPGIFLLVNVAFTVLYLSTTSQDSSIPVDELTRQLIGNSGVVIGLLIILGYPCGMALRLLKTNNIDNISARYIAFLAFLDPKKSHLMVNAPIEGGVDGKSSPPREPAKPAGKRMKSQKTVYKIRRYLSDKFFYGNWMREKIRNCMPAETARFYDDFWDDKYTEDIAKNTTFFNFCKTIIARVDSQSAIDIYSAEAITRFLAEMYYALQFSIILIGINLAISLIHTHVTIMIVTLGLGLFYIFLFHTLLSQFRFMRAKEVDTVFNASFANREEFYRLFPTRASRSLLPPINEAFLNGAGSLRLAAWKRRWENDTLVRLLDLDSLAGQMEDRLPGRDASPILRQIDREKALPFSLPDSQVEVSMMEVREDGTRTNPIQRNPGWMETILVVSGSLHLRWNKDGQEHDMPLKKMSYATLEPGESYWLSAGEEPVMIMTIHHKDKM